MLTTDTVRVSIFFLFLLPPSPNQPMIFYCARNKKKQVEPFPDASWKKDAQAATIYELPRIRSTGLELGPTRGLGDTIYGDDDRDHGGQMTRLSASRGGGGGVNAVRGGTGGGGGGGAGDAYAEASRLRKDGKWLGELDVRRQLFADNPLLQR